ncbi:hypothetical protein NQ318_016535 [Aromia moschata]|uniref:Uncharacterized protein n=1 Tax=Aromia moschata TaxID=1265417 RepID=A0AAV8YXM1_9CUCU|nr:hypothetical protein NQ318_016535 [Aromia moschata]
MVAAFTGVDMADIPQYGFKAEDMISTGRTTKCNIEEVRKWLSKQPEIPQMSDEQIALFLIACNNVIEATQITIECYFRHKANSPELFKNRDADSQETQSTLGVA